MGNKKYESPDVEVIELTVNDIMVESVGGEGGIIDDDLWN